MLHVLNQLAQQYYERSFSAVRESRRGWELHQERYTNLSILQIGNILKKNNE